MLPSSATISSPGHTIATPTDGQLPPSGATTSPSLPPVASSSQTVGLSQSSIPPIPSTPASIPPTSSVLTSTTSSATSLSNAGASPQSSTKMSSGTSSVKTSQSSLPSSFSSSMSNTATTSSSLPASTSSPGAVEETPGVSPVSPQGSSTNIVLIAVPIVVGAVLVALLVLFLCWWKRKKSFRGAYHRRNRSDDTEMSEVSSDAREISHEPKAQSEHHDADTSGSPNIPTTIVEQAEPKTWPAEARKFEPEILPGLASMSPTGNSFVSPPPYRKNERGSDSSSVLLPDLIGMGPPNTAGHSRRPASAQRPSTAKRQTMSRSADTGWPLPSPSKDANPRDNMSNERRWATGAENGDDSPRALPSWPSTPRTSNHGREGIGGPSSPVPLLPSPAPQNNNPNGSPRHVASQSPFDDSNAHDSLSQCSTSGQGMPGVAEEKQINDDGVSEMSVSSRGSKSGSRLHRRVSDEISVVSSLHDDENGTGEHDDNDDDLAGGRVESPTVETQRR